MTQKQIGYSNVQPGENAMAKQIVMLQATCLNESGWARVMSRFGRVSLAQLEGFKFMEHVEVWEDGKCISSTPPRQCVRLGFLDEATFGLVMFLTTLRRAWPVVRHQKADVIVASANSMVLAALVLRLIGRAKKVVCFVADYFPPHPTKPVVTVYRWISSVITRQMCRWSDEAWALSPRIQTVRSNQRHFVVLPYINDELENPVPRTEVIYSGMPSPDHALEILFEVCRRHGLKLNVIGDSAYLRSIRHLAPSGAVFHGFVSDEKYINAVSARCFCGYAIYRNIGPGNYSYYGLPSKIIKYIASNTPVLTTGTSDFSKKIETLGVGRVVEPQPDQIEGAILDLKNRVGEFSESIAWFKKEWNNEVERFHKERLEVLLS